MKKIILLIFMLLLCVGSVSAITWHPADSVVVAWDRSLLLDGNPVPDTDSITYYVYSRNPDGTDVKLLGSTNVLEYTVTVPVDTKIIVGVSAQRTFSDGTQTDESEINWSDNVDGNFDPEPFGLSNIRSAASPDGFRKK